MAYEQTDQWNKIKSPEIDPSTYGIIIYNKGVISNYQGKGEFDSK